MLSRYNKRGKRLKQAYTPRGQHAPSVWLLFPLPITTQVHKYDESSAPLNARLSAIAMRCWSFSNEFLYAGIEYEIGWVLFGVQRENEGYLVCWSLMFVPRDRQSTGRRTHWVGELAENLVIISVRRWFPVKTTQRLPLGPLSCTNFNIGSS